MALALSGCSLSQLYTSHNPRRRSFIAYWPPPSNDGHLRLAVKDVIDVKGVVTTAGSAYFARTHPPATEDAACLKIARERNVRIVGKTNLSEFAISPSGVNDHFGTPRSPLSKNPKLIPGGSSSGSATAVADDMADVALGTDTTGSIRLPAACCGIVGLKTTLGLVPMKGVYPIEPHLDTVGPLAKDISHEVQGMDLLERGFAEKYRSAQAEHPSARGITVGRLYLKGTSSDIDKAVDAALARAHFHVVPLSKSFREAWEQAAKDAATVASAGAWMSDREYGSKSGVSARSKIVIAVGKIAYSTGAYQKALERRLVWQREIHQIFQHVDLIALPTIQKRPPKFQPFVRSALFEAEVLGLQNTAAVNLAGNPALAVPVPMSDPTVPVTSLQFIAPLRREAALLNAGRLIESHQPPPSKPVPAS